ncbi:MAG: right-handed parallel beta-helix repeat-containing protein [Kiritimatiellaceae bacterium]|nr:right-handed parallel beta-helix repeat-containing protein [Kiritimatiellaceae bacterium]
MKEILIAKILDDMSPIVFQALEACGDDAILKFQKGEYHFYPDQAFEKHYYISNNSASLKRIAFPVIGRKNLTIDGGGSRFIFHGEMMPFVVEKSSGITLKNFSVDWRRPFYSQGIITQVDDSGVEVKIDWEKYPFHMEGDQVVFDGEGWSHTLHDGIFEMDVRTGCPAWLSGDSLGRWMTAKDFSVTQIDAGTIRFNNKFERRAIVGNVLLLRHYSRLCPGIHLKQSRNIRIEQVELNHAGGMGVIAQFSEDIHLKNFTIRPTPGTDRMFSVTVDATHFVNCRGLIRIEDCHFENQMDDPANLHGTNTRIKERLDDYSVVTELVHNEQYGFEIAFPGDTLSFAHNDDLLVYASATVKAVEPINAQFCRIVFDEKLPDALRVSDVLDNQSWVADAHISGCFSHNNRARGYLLSTPGKIVLENNRIAAAGSAVKISGDANYWFESGAVRDVLIRNNAFGDCCYGPQGWGRAVIDIDPEISNPWKNRECYHRNIHIENNTFRTFDTGILYARSVDGITFKNNMVERTETYPMIRRMKALLTFDACKGIDVADNRIQAGIKEPLLENNEIPPSVG